MLNSVQWPVLVFVDELLMFECERDLNALEWQDIHEWERLRMGKIAYDRIGQKLEFVRVEPRTLFVPAALLYARPGLRVVGPAPPEELHFLRCEVLEALKDRGIAVNEEADIVELVGVLLPLMNPQR